MGVRRSSALRAVIMSKPRYRQAIHFEQPTTFRIRIQGHLDATWSENLSGVSITAGIDDDVQVTTLAGRVADQAVLAGILNTLYELRFPLLSVECIGAEVDQDSGEGSKESN